MQYKLSQDYEKLHKLINEGFIAAGFVDYKYPNDEKIYRDICKIEKHCENRIIIGSRGFGYGGVWPFEVTITNNEKDIFIRSCKSINLGWIDQIVVSE